MTRNNLMTTVTPSEADAMMEKHYNGWSSLYVMDGVECAFYQVLSLDLPSAFKLMEKAGTVEHWHWGGSTSLHTLDFRIGNTVFSCTLNKPEEASK
jgi:hypothetical protein